MSDVGTTRQLALGTGRRHRRILPRWVRRLAGPLLLVAVWLMLTATGLVSSRTFPTVPDVWRAGSALVSQGVFLPALGVSARRVAIGLAIGLGSGLVIAVVAGMWGRAEDVVDSGMQVFKAIPTFALVPLLIVWLGIYESPKITLIALATAWPVYFNTFSGIRNIDRRFVEAAHTLGLGRWGIVRHVVVPGSMPGFLVGLRISLTNAWLALVIAEEINATNGLGMLLSDARIAFRLDRIVFVIVVYAALGMLSYALVRLLEESVLVWRPGFEGEQ